MTVKFQEFLKEHGYKPEALELGWSDAAREAAAAARKATGASAKAGHNGKPSSWSAAADQETSKAMNLTGKLQHEGGNAALAHDAADAHDDASEAHAKAAKLGGPAAKHHTAAAKGHADASKQLRVAAPGFGGARFSHEPALELAWSDAAREAAAAARQASMAAHDSFRQQATAVFGRADKNRSARDASKKAHVAGTAHADENMTMMQAAIAARDAEVAHRGAAAKLKDLGLDKAAKAHEAAAVEQRNASSVLLTERRKSGSVSLYGKGEEKTAVKTDVDQHEAMRVKTMSDQALGARISKIKDKDKLQRFAGALKAAGKHDLAKQARSRAMRLADDPDLAAQGGANPLLADADKRAKSGQAGSLNSLAAELRTGSTPPRGFETPNTHKSNLER